MAHCNFLTLLLVIIVIITTASSTPARKSKKVSNSPLLTCPGFPGYCSESYPGGTCSVVCSRGRNNVPKCQEDGTWTDIPRCIEHEPGQEQQRTEHCPGIPGYCSLDLPGGLCEFACSVGPAIRSSCTVDGTWEPYPTCQNDPRETQDGCNPCPGPLGGERNRTLESGGGGRSAGKGGNKIQSFGGKKQAGGRRGVQTGGGQSGSGGVKSGGGQRRNGGGGQNRKAGGGQNRGQNKSGGGQKKTGGRGASRGGGEEVARRSGGGGQNNGVGQCPGEELQVCIDVCPGFNARVFGACVAGCAKRCPGRK